MLPLLVGRCIKILYDTTGLFCELLCKVFRYCDVLNSLVWHWRGPKGARLGRCTLYFPIFTVYSEMFC